MTVEIYKKTCKRCNESLTIDNFCKDRKQTDGLNTWCRNCTKVYKSTYKPKTKSSPISKDKQIEYYLNRISKPGAMVKIRERAGLYRKNNRDAIRTREKSKENLKKRADYIKERKNTDINFKLRSRLRTRLWSVIKNKEKKGSAVNDLGCSVDELKVYLESKFQEGMCWENWGNTVGCWSIDHIKPLSSFDLTNREKFLEACHYTNLQPLWHIDNLRKKDKVHGY